MTYRSVSIVITTYNGINLLRRFLPSVVAAAEFYKGSSEIIVVDDAGADGSDGFIGKEFPAVRLVKLEENLGPLLATNEGIRQSKNQIVVLLDNDVMVARDFIYPLVAPFDAGDIFGVMPAGHLLSPKTAQEEAGRFTKVLEFKRGFLETPVIKLKEPQEKKFIFLLGGGAAAIDRNKLDKVGAWDELLSPFYWEDVDLSYRAWKRGWKILYEPKSLIHHQGNTSINKEYRSRYVDKIAERNRYILVWKNLLDKRLLFYHLWWVPLRLIGNLLTGRYWRIVSFFCALRLIKPIRLKRRIELKEAEITDRELLNFFSEIKSKGIRL